jgi:hypothetical protein
MVKAYANRVRDRRADAAPVRHTPGVPGRTRGVKIQYGTWAKLGQTILNVSANGQKSKTFNHTFGCGINRRYKFYVTESGQGSKTIYKPNANDWTKSTNLTVNINF